MRYVVNGTIFHPCCRDTNCTKCKGKRHFPCCCPECLAYLDRQGQREIERELAVIRRPQPKAVTRDGWDI